MDIHRLLPRPAAIVRGTNVYLRPPHRRDFREWAALRHASRDFLQPWEPVWADDELSLAAFRGRIRRAKADAQDGTAHVFLIFRQSDHALMGGIAIGNIRHGVSLSGQIGYWMGAAYAGKGFMQDAVLAVVDHGFDRLGLHRLEAACIPGNARSVRVLEKTGFAREGLLKSYLKINGQWQDHLLFARISGVNG